jgi:hypothetical protein
LSGTLSSLWVAVIRALMLLALGLAVTSSAEASDGCARRFASDDPDSGYRWLENQQEEVFLPTAKTCETLKKESIKRMRRMIGIRLGAAPEFQQEMLALLSQPLPTRYETPEQYHLIAGAARRIERFAKARLGGPMPKIDWGSLPVLSVNAGATKFKDDYVVYLNHHLLPFAFALFATIDRTVTYREVRQGVQIDYDVKDFRASLRQDPEIAEVFAKLVVNFAKDIEPPKLRLVGGEVFPTMQAQLDATRLFIVGHEFGHVLNRDPDVVVASMAAKGRAGRKAVPAIARDWSKELKADKIGYELAAASDFAVADRFRGEPPYFRVTAMYAPILYLHLADALEDAMFCGGSGQGSAGRMSAAGRQVVLRAARDALNGGAARPPPVAKILGCRLQDHPPAWVRAEMLAEQVKRTRVRHPYDFSGADAGVSWALIRNVGMLRSAAKRNIRRGCAQEPPCSLD